MHGECLVQASDGCLVYFGRDFRVPLNNLLHRKFRQGKCCFWAGWRGKRFVFLTFSLCFALAGNSYAQETFDLKAADTSSPRSTLLSFIDACNQFHQVIRSQEFFDRSDAAHSVVSNRILDCLDQSELPAFARKQRAGEVAACLKEILDREELPEWEDVPDEAAIEAAGGFENLSRWRVPGTRITIARVEAGPQKHEYLFSTGTVDRAVDYFHEIESRPYRTTGPSTSPGFFDWFISAPGHPALAKIYARLSESQRASRTLGLATWKWPGVIIALGLSVFLIMVFYNAQIKFTERARNRSLILYWLTLLFPIGAMLTPWFFEHFAQRYLTIRSSALYVLSFGAILVGLFAAIIVIFATTRRIAETVIASPRISSTGLNAELIRICARLTSVLGTGVVFIVGGQYLGIPVATLLASAGIGGVAVALGAQDTLKTLFGTISLMADKPFRVGDRIQYKDYDGAVEDIGLRSTRLRLLTGNLVTIPNDLLAGNDVANVGKRPHIRRDATIYLPLHTDLEKIEQAVNIIRELLAQHEGHDPGFPPRVFLDDFTTDGFKIRFTYWYSPPDYWKFKAFGDELNFEICRKFLDQQIPFALPTRVSCQTGDHKQWPLEKE